MSNKVQTLSGKWLSLDGRMLHRMAVAASERYNTLLEAGVTRRLGVVFAARENTPGKRPVREIVGVPAGLECGVVLAASGDRYCRCQPPRVANAASTAPTYRHPDAPTSSSRNRPKIRAFCRRVRIRVTP